ncbi:hypothetical protein A9Q94_02135 [Rhodobacterales bacterium 56_14_T64]|nr:hypothetical protein A9Q94_02135 [Rhodobacterales bacterium 56_14_T64]
MTYTEILAKHSLPPPSTQLIWTAIVDVADRQDLGPSPAGHRYIVPILGGRFYGGPDIEGLNGMILAGGADRQLLRPDGIKELDALYEMKTDSGIVIVVHNKVIVDDTRKPDRYAMSTIRATVPDGSFAWLNRRLLIGTLQSARPDRQAVIIGAWVADVDTAVS